MLCDEVFRSRSPIITAYTLCNHVLEEHHTNPYLRVLLIGDAKWSAHISAIYMQLSQLYTWFLSPQLIQLSQGIKGVSKNSLSSLKVGICIMCGIPTKKKTLRQLNQYNAGVDDLSVGIMTGTTV